MILSSQLLCYFYLMWTWLDYIIVNPVNTPVFPCSLNSIDVLSIKFMFFSLAQKLCVYTLCVYTYFRPFFFNSSMRSLTSYTVLSRYFQFSDPPKSRNSKNCCGDARALNAPFPASPPVIIIKYQTPSIYKHGTYITNVPYHISVTDLIWFPTHSYFHPDQNIMAKVQSFFPN